MPDLDSLNWKSFWGLATPERAANLLRELYGEDAAGAAASCLAAALADNRDEDSRFWDAVQAALCPRPLAPTPPETTSRH